MIHKSFNFARARPAICNPSTPCPPLYRGGWGVGVNCRSEWGRAFFIFSEGFKWQIFRIYKVDTF